METLVRLYSNKENEIKNFFDVFGGNINIDNSLKWERHYTNPIDMADIIGTFIENKDKYSINMWISLDKDVLINVTEKNADKIIRYLFERYPY